MSQHNLSLDMVKRKLEEKLKVESNLSAKHNLIRVQTKLEAMQKQQDSMLGRKMRMWEERAERIFDQTFTGESKVSRAFVDHKRVELDRS